MNARAAILIAIAAFPAGCSYNPGYTPDLLPGGPIVQNHAKPSGIGYFSNFDPKAVKLEVTPDGLVTAPLGSSVVLVGTVRDKDGQARRSRRIEWVVDGPGNIIEADESGVWPGRGYKVDNKFAVSYTKYLTHTITRGNNDPKDDVVICPGQTFCVLSSSIPGESLVTVYAPEVFDWERGRVNVRIIWGDGRFNFPPPVVTRCGSEYTLTTTINNAANSPDTTTSGFRVRYRLVDGPPAVLATRTATGVVTGTAAAGAQEVEANIDANGTASVQLAERDKKPGKTRVAIEVVKPGDAGNKDLVVARRDTVVEWADPKVELSVTAPKVAAVSGTFPVTVALENESGADSLDAQVKVTLSDGATLARSEPPPLRQDANGGLIFAVPAVAGKASQTVTLEVKPAKLGPVTVIADAVTKDGLQATHKATTRIDQGRLQLVVEAPPLALANEPIPYRVAVTNAGGASAENVVVWAQLDPGLSHPSPQNPVELSAGSINPGQTKTLDLPVTAKSTGHYTVRASATGDGNLTAKSDPAGVDVKRAELTASVAGPNIAYLNSPFDWTVTVTNTADTTLSNVILKATVPQEVRATVASDSGAIGPGSIEWKLGEMKPHEPRTVKVSVETVKLSAKATLSAAVMADAVNGTQLVGDPVAAKAEGSVAVIGSPVLVLDVATPPASVDVGKRLTFQVRVKNQGTVAVRNIQVTGKVPPELKGIQGTGPVQGRVDPTGPVVFPAVDELQPGATLTYSVVVEGAKAGPAVFQAVVNASHLAKPLQEEQNTRVTGK